MEAASSSKLKRIDSPRAPTVSQRTLGREVERPSIASNKTPVIAPRWTTRFGPRKIGVRQRGTMEIDLLRGGRPMPPEERPDCDYSVLISRSERRPAAAFWPIRLRERLPAVPIPLKDNRSEPVDLQEVLHHTYDGPGYEHFIYDGAPEPPLRSDDHAWAAAFLA